MNLYVLNNTKNNYTMKQFKLTLLLIILMSMVGLQAFADWDTSTEVQVNGLYYYLDNDNLQAQVTSMPDGEYTGDIGIPSSITYQEKNYSVTDIGYGAFAGCSGLTSITIPNSVTSIGNEAFNSCTGLTSVTLNSNTLVSKAYTTDNNIKTIFGEQVTEYVIGDGVTSIGRSAFRNCSDLTSINIPNSVTSIGGSAFQSCSGLTSVIIPNSVTSIGDYAFYKCYGLESVTIGNGVTSIGDAAFESCNGLKKVIVSDIAAWCGISFGNEYSNPLTCAHHLYSDENTEITDLVIPDGVSSINDYAFYLCSGLTSVTIPNSVTSIGSSAFYGCSDLTSVTLNSNAVVSKAYTADNNMKSIFGNQVSEYTIGKEVESIGAYAFYGCTNLISVTLNSNAIVSRTYTAGNNMKNIFGNQVREYVIGDDVTNIGDNVFSGCTGLTSVTIGNSITGIGGSAFGYCSNLTSVTLNSNAIVSKSYNIFNNMKNIFGEQVTEYIIGDDVTKIGNTAFYECSGLISVTIGSGVTSIGEGAFNGCSGLNSVIIGNSVTSIGRSAFAYCHGLTSVTIPNSVKSIGSNAFENCHGITSVTIPNSVTSIGECAFFGCSGLISVTIPSSVTSIGESTFKDCTSLTGIDIPNSVTSIGDYAFYSCRALTSVIIPNSVTSIGNSAFIDCYSLTSVTIPNSVTSIDEAAFAYCRALTSVTIPNSVTSIGRGAFSGCTGLTSMKVESGNVKYDSRNNCNAIIETETDSLLSGCKNTVIPASVTAIGDEAFYGCSSLTAIIIPNNVTSIGGSAFQSCSGLTSVIIGNSVTSIGLEAFRGCSGLTSIAIPNSVTTIDGNAFDYCSGLTSVTIGNSVTTIGVQVFINCDDLTSVTALNPTPAAITQDVFTNRKNATLYVPKGSKDAYKAADYWKEFKEIIEIDPTGIDQISFQENGEQGIDQEGAGWYTIDGKQVDKPKKGINIIRMSNGTTKKVVVK